MKIRFHIQEYPPCLRTDSKVSICDKLPDSYLAYYVTCSKLISCCLISGFYRLIKLRHEKFHDSEQACKAAVLLAQHQSHL